MRFWFSWLKRDVTLTVFSRRADNRWSCQCWRLIHSSFLEDKFWSFRDHLWIAKMLVAFYTPLSFAISFCGPRWVHWIVNVFLSAKHLCFLHATFVTFLCNTLLEMIIWFMGQVLVPSTFCTYFLFNLFSFA